MPGIEFENLEYLASGGEVVSTLKNYIQASKAKVIGIIGAGGSGKTTFSKKLVESFGLESCVMISVDDYWKYPRAEMNKMGITGYDWAAREKELFSKHMQCLRENKSIEKPIFEDDKEEPTFQTEHITPKDFVIVEGVVNLLEVSDISVFVYAPDEVLMVRRLERDKVKSVNKNFDEFKNYLIKKSFPKYRSLLFPLWKQCNFLFDTHNNKLYKIR